MARKIHQQICANCKHSFREGENYCPNCGQDNHSPNQPIRHYTSELVESILHLDSKILLTFKTILFYPGKITKEYNENIRARFTPPVRLYVFISFVFFVLIQIPKTLYDIVDHSQKSNATTQDSLADNEKLSNKIKNFKMDSLQDSLSIDAFGSIKFQFKKTDLPKYKNATPDQIDSLILENHLTPGYFTRNLLKQIIKSANADEDFKHRLKEKAIKFGSVSLFLLMPFFGFLVFIFYLRRKKFYYEYLIFSLHYHTVVFLFMSLIIIVNLIIKLPEWFYFLMILGLLYYLGKALRYNFEGTRKRTILKMFVICSIYSFTLLFVLLTVIFLSWWFV